MLSIFNPERKCDSRKDTAALSPTLSVSPLSFSGHSCAERPRCDIHRETLNMTTEKLTTYIKSPICQNDIESLDFKHII